MFSYEICITLKSQNVMGDRLVEIAHTEFPCDEGGHRGSATHFIMLFSKVVSLIV